MSYRKSRGETKVLAEKETVQLVQKLSNGDHRLESILVLLAWFAADVFARNNLLSSSERQFMPVTLMVLLQLLD